MAGSSGRGGVRKIDGENGEKGMGQFSLTKNLRK